MNKSTSTNNYINIESDDHIIFIETIAIVGFIFSVFGLSCYLFCKRHRRAQWTWKLLLINSQYKRGVKRTKHLALYVASYIAVSSFCNGIWHYTSFVPRSRFL